MATLCTSRQHATAALNSDVWQHCVLPALRLPDQLRLLQACPQLDRAAHARTLHRHARRLQRALRQYWHRACWRRWRRSGAPRRCARCYASVLDGSYPVQPPTHFDVWVEDHDDDDHGDGNDSDGGGATYGVQLFFCGACWTALRRRHAAECGVHDTCRDPHFSLWWTAAQTQHFVRT